jgi:tetratricopeptide (TPR) repeat protein
MEEQSGVRIFIMLVFLGAIGLSAAFAGEESTEPRIESCIQLFRMGEYQNSADSLQALLNTVSTRSDSLSVLKYLAFSYCMLSKTDEARKQFGIALEKDPAMELDTLESPPSITLVFKQAKLASLDKAMAAIGSAQPAQPVKAARKKNPVVPIVLLTAAAGSAGVGGYYYYQGSLLQQEYRALKGVNQADYDNASGLFYDAYLKSGACSGVSAALITVSIFLIFKRETPNKPVAILVSPGKLMLTYSF